MSFLRGLAEESSSSASQHHLLASLLSNTFLFLLIFGLSVTVPMNQFRQQFSKNVYALLTGIVLQFAIMPALGYVAVLLGGFPYPMGLALLVVTASPGGSYSNWWCSIFNADLALSVAMTAVSTILSIGLLPANLLLYSHLAFHNSSSMDSAILHALDFKSLFLSLGIVIGAIVLGLVISWKLGNSNSRGSKCLRQVASHGANLSGLALIVFSAVLSSAGKSSDEENNTKLWSQDWKFYTLVAFPCLVGMTLSNILGKFVFRLNKPECVSIAIECAYQNVGIAVSVAVTMFSNPVHRSQALVVPLYYGLLEAILIGIYCIVAWKCGWTKAPAKDGFCKVISTNYNTTEGDNLLLDEDSAAAEADDALMELDSTAVKLPANRQRLASEDNTVATSVEIEC